MLVLKHEMKEETAGRVLYENQSYCWKNNVLAPSKKIADMDKPWRWSENPDQLHTYWAEIEISFCFAKCQKLYLDLIVEVTNKFSWQK